MLRKYSHIKYESMAQIRSTIAEIKIFSKGLFIIGAPCMYLCGVIDRTDSLDAVAPQPGGLNVRLCPTSIP